ncbi:Clavaminate synthase-like protein [Aulographum hederae CBS 113979]|uniref:Clavaminate synthase-like protein n=1 Tax=Aulographum hederae CBS 113979 TaxID=1176131 RepID=A0A6G1H0U9_9PEZI|nr:Clavaminate synthase-like protein [Aulographum hederae CBS 113979]
MAPNPVDSAVSKDNLFIPLIDFSAHLHGTPAERLTCASALLHGFQTAGFVYLKNFDVAPLTLSRVFSHSAKFFERPQAQKDELAWYSPEANRGYVAHGREKVTQLEDHDEVEALRAANPDLKESLEIGRDDEAGLPNMWPDKFDEAGKEFKEVMKAFHDECKNLHMEVMRSVALGMGIEEDWFDGFTDKGDNTLRLLHYPGVKRSMFKEKTGQVRAGEHSDYGSITLLFQDDRGGLQVKSPDGTFVDATPIEGTVVINAGDLLARWSNDTIKSTKHRVVEPPLKKGQEVGVGEDYPPRYSIAYFCNPNFDRMIEAIPGTFEENGKKYEGINSGEYLVKRLTATY